MSYVPKYILKRMFPKKKCVKVVKKDGKSFLMLQMINVLSPIAVPDKIDLGDFDVNTAPDYAEIKINGVDLPLTVDDVKKYVSIWVEGTGYTYDDIFANKAAGITIGMGGKLTLLIDMEYPGLKEAVPGTGDYEVAVDVKLDNPMSVKVPTILSEWEVDFDPSWT